MARCKLDLKSSNTFNTQLKKLCKKFAHAESDLQAVIKYIEADHRTRKANGTRLRMADYPELQGRVFKYDFGSSDMKKHPRDSFRLIALSFEDPDKMADQMLYAVMCYHRPNNDTVSPKEVSDCLKELKSTLT